MGFTASIIWYYIPTLNAIDNTPPDTIINLHAVLLSVNLFLTDTLSTVYVTVNGRFLAFITLLDFISIP